MRWADEVTVNLNYQRGTYPKVQRDGDSSTKLFYCYYTPSDDNDDDDDDGTIYICCMNNSFDRYKLLLEDGIKRY